MTYFKKTCMLNDAEKHMVGEMIGKIFTWSLEGRSIGYISDNLNISPVLVEYNIDELLYVIRKQVGIRRYLKMLFVK